MAETIETSYVGLNKITEIKPCLFADIMSGDNESRQKINELIKVVNRIVDVLNGQLR